MLAFLAIVQQRRDPKMQPHRVQQPELTLPCLPEVYRMPITNISLFQIRSGGPFHFRSCTSITIECLILLLYKHNCNHSTFFMQVVFALAILQLKKNIKMKIYAQNIL